jgi:hypothetical protein
MERIIKTLAALAMAAVGAGAQAQYHAEFIEHSKAWGSVVADFNNDGHDDIFITGHDEHDRIWYWTAAGYVPSNQVLVWVDRHDCDAADVNLDGRLDLYCSVGADKGHGQGPKELWLQDASGVFVLQANHGAEDPYGSGRRVVFFDFNHDGYPDIYLTNERRPRADSHDSFNRVFVNQHDAHFVEAHTLATGDHGHICAAKGDIDNDGWDDLIVCALDAPPHIYLNNRAGDFTELVTPAVGLVWRDAKLADMNGDGLLDLVMTTAGNLLQIWFNTGTAPYFDKPAYQDHTVYTPKALTIGDFNHDGHPDVYVVQMKADCPSQLVDVAADVLYESQAGGGWLRVKQPQGDLNGCGFGADTVDGDKVLLMNGGIIWRGDNYVLSWGP